VQAQDGRELGLHELMWIDEDGQSAKSAVG
jgi:hypothetical protein